MKRFPLLLVLLIFFASETFSMTWEFGLRIVDNGGNGVQRTVSLYNASDNSLFRSVTSVYPLVSTGGYYLSLWCDIGDNNTSGATWDAIPRGTYKLRVENKYVVIDIPATGNAGDFVLQYNIDTQSFSVVFDNSNNVTVNSTNTWVDYYNVTFQNNLLSDGNGGTITVNNSQYNSPTSIFFVQQGSSITASAIDQTVIDVNYVFNNWSNGSTSRSTTFTPSSNVTYTANFVSHVYVGISGPLRPPVTGTWTANVSGGFSPYTYQWYYKYNGGSWQASGSTSTLSMYIGTTGYILRVDVRDSRNYTATSQLAVAPPDPKISAGSSSAKLAKESEPKEFKLEQNSPNPFNPSTIISYQLPNDGFVSLKVFDILGREVKTLVNEVKTQGKYSVNFDAANLASGIYIYQLKANGFSSIKKMILTK